MFALATATGDVDWAVRARDLLDGVLEAGEDTDPVLVAQGITFAPDQTDGDLPSGGAALARAALSAWRLGAGEHYRAAAEVRVRAHATAALRHPFGHGSLLGVAVGLVDAPRQVVVVEADAGSALADAVRRIDADVIAVVTTAQSRAFAAAGFELFEGKVGEGVAYDCRAFTCRLPVRDPAEISVLRN